MEILEVDNTEQQKEKKLNRVPSRNEKTSRNQALQQKYHQSIFSKILDCFQKSIHRTPSKIRGCSQKSHQFTLCKILGNILKIDTGRTDKWTKVQGNL